MEAKDISRLFISEYSAIGCKWFPDGISRLNSKDMLFFFNEGLSPPNEKIKLQIHALEKKGQAVIYSVEALINNKDNADLKKYILNLIKKNVNENTYVAFMCWPELYQGLKGDLDHLVHDHGNFKNVKFIKRIQRAKPISHNDATAKDAEALADALSSIHISVDNMIHTETDTCNTSAIDKTKEFNSTNIDSGGHNKHPPQGNFSTNKNQKANTTSQPNAKEFGSTTGFKTFNSKSKRPMVEPEVEEDLDTIENRIFQEFRGKQEVDRDFSAMAQVKAQYVDSLFKRLVNGINKYVDNSQVGKLNDKQYLEFVMVLLKVDNYDDYQRCWNAAGDKNFHITLNAESFLYLREEAVYYSRTCEMIYEQDKWG